jgi:hypothetical protein
LANAPPTWLRRAAGRAQRGAHAPHDGGLLVGRIEAQCDAGDVERIDGDGERERGAGAGFGR